MKRPKTLSKISSRIFVGYRLNALFEDDTIFIKINLSVPSMIYLSIIYLNVNLITEFLIYIIYISFFLTLFMVVSYKLGLRLTIIIAAAFILMFFLIVSTYSFKNPYCGKGSIIIKNKNFIIEFEEHHNKRIAGGGYVHIHTYYYLHRTSHGDIFRDRESKICPVD
jgi:hypothetical protein